MSYEAFHHTSSPFHYSIPLFHSTIPFHHSLPPNADTHSILTLPNVLQMLVTNIQMGEFHIRSTFGWNVITAIAQLLLLGGRGL